MDSFKHIYYVKGTHRICIIDKKEMVLNKTHRIILGVQFGMFFPSNWFISINFVCVWRRMFKITLSKLEASPNISSRLKILLAARISSSKIMWTERLFFFSMVLLVGTKIEHSPLTDKIYIFCIFTEYVSASIKYVFMSCTRILKLLNA